MKLGYTVTKVLDRGVIESVGPYGLSTVLGNTGFNISRLDTGIVTSYALYIVLGFISILFIVLPYLLTGAPNLIGLDSSISTPYTILANNITEIRLLIVLSAALVFATRTQN